MQHKNTLMTTLAITALMLSIGAQATVGEWLNEKASLVEKLIGENTEGTTQHRASPDLTQLRPTLHQNVAASFMAVVVRVSDGDTIRVLSGDKNAPEHNEIRVRLAEIDAPEKGQPWGNKSRQALSSMLAGKTVSIIPQSNDRYGRLVAWVYTEDSAGTHLGINREMVRTGNAWVYPEYVKSPELPGLQEQAWAKKTGLWSLPSSEILPPWEWRKQKRMLKEKTGTHK